MEGYGAYGVIASELIGQFVQPVHEDMVAATQSAGLLRVPADVDPETLGDALYIPPQMPWIDPKKEADAMESLERNVHASGPEIIRRRGQNPRDVMEQEAAWRRALREHELAATAAPNMETDDAEEVGPRTRRRA